MIIVPPFNPEPSPTVLANRKRYESDPELRQLADNIHHHRMMPPPACDQCIEMAIYQLETKRKNTVDNPPQSVR